MHHFSSLQLVAYSVTQLVSRLANEDASLSFGHSFIANLSLHKSFNWLGCPSIIQSFSGCLGESVKYLVFI